MQKEYILGINGWFEGSHDASAVLVEFDREASQTNVIAGLEEEKVVGKKGLFDIFPTNSIKEILNIAHLVPKDLDAISFGWNYPLVYKNMNQNLDISNQKILELLFPEESDLNIPIYFFNHHLSHANSSHYVSGFDKSLSLVIDGNGEVEATSLWLFDDEYKECIETFSPISSFGFLFEATNLMLGFRENESGKTMGLAGYGAPVYAERILKYFGEDLHPSEKLEKVYRKFKNSTDKKLLLPFQELSIRTWLYIFQYDLDVHKMKNNCSSFYEFPQELKDLAASVQLVLETKVLEYIVKKSNEYHIKNISMSGGVALNCILNGKILNLSEIDEVYVQPASADSGVALGAALEYVYQKGYDPQVFEFSPYIGKEYSDYEVETFLKDKKVNYCFVEDASKKIAEYIENDKIIGIFQGRNEWGPRALGNRTIISLPSYGKLDFINEKVKTRELGRPLAPSLLYSDLNHLISKTPKVFGKYMNIAHYSDVQTDNTQSVIHVDQTFRPQCVFKKDNEMFFKQLEEIKKRLGSSIVINTSFNGETPILYNLDQVLDFINSRYIDFVVINNKYILSR